MSSSAFPKILHIGDKQILDLFEGEVEITEKLDGSQFGFGMVDGELVTRSKGRVIIDPDKLFIPAVDHVRSIEHLLPEDLFFYGETLCQPRHSTLAYDRTPTNNIALFGVFNRRTKEFPEAMVGSGRFTVRIKQYEDERELTIDLNLASKSQFKDWTF